MKLRRRNFLQWGVCTLAALLISPHQRGKKRPVTQDGRALRRYRHRWKIGRTISWLQNYRRLATRYEVHVHLFLGFTQLAALLTTFNGCETRSNLHSKPIW